MGHELLESGGSMPAAVDQAESVVAAGGTMQQVKTGYTTAISVQQPRSVSVVQTRLLEEAMMAGDAAYYGWGAGKDKIEGPTIKLAMMAARCWGNCATDVQPVQETPDAWIFTAVFIDLETGFTCTRQFRQSKDSTVYGKHDAERKNEMRFGNGQSKAIRNAIINTLPSWLIDKAIDKAKEGVRVKIEKYVKANGLVAAVDYILAELKKEGVTEDRVLAKCEVAKSTGLDVDNIVMLRGDLTALHEGQERAETLFPFPDAGEAVASDLEKAAADKAANSQSGAASTPPQDDTPVDQETAGMQDMRLEEYKQTIAAAPTARRLDGLRDDLDADKVLNDKQIAGLRLLVTARAKKIEEGESR